MPQLSKRLQAILNTVPPCDVLADIGCDHGKLIVAAVENNICKTGIGADISTDSLQKAKAYVQEKNLTEKIHLYISDGFSSINVPIDIAVIAGMGANEIVKIISEKNAANTYVLCPHQDAEILREYINDSFTVVKDFIVCDKRKYYPILLVEKRKTKGEPNYTEEELFLGKNIPETNDYHEKNKNRLVYLEKLMQKNKQNKLSKNLLREYEALLKWQKSKM